MTFSDIGGGVGADRSKSFDLINRGYSPDIRKAGQWFETTEDVYDYFLGVLPPLHFGSGAFMMREASTAFLSDAFVQMGEHWFCLTVERNGAAGFDKTVRAFRDHLAAQVAS